MSGQSEGLTTPSSGRLIGEASAFINVTSLHAVAHLIWRLGRTSDGSHDPVLSGILLQRALSESHGSSHVASLLKDIQSRVDGTVLIAFLLDWAEYAFPRLTIKRELASSLMATAVTDDVVESIQPPWNAFTIDLPTDLIYVQGAREIVAAVRGYAHFFVVREHAEREPGLFQRHIDAGLVDAHFEKNPGPYDAMPEGHFYYKSVERCSLMLVAQDGTLISRSAMPRSALSERVAVSEPAFEDGVQSLTKIDDRAMDLFVKLVAGTMMAASHPSDLVPVNKDAKKSNKFNARGSFLPRGERLFELRRPVTIDVSRAISEYSLTGRGSSPTVQTLVRGHWKRQACGTALSERRWIQIEPYWRGPEDALVAVRPHVIR